MPLDFLHRFGPRVSRFVFTPPEKDATINILEGAVRSSKTWALHSKILYGCRYPVAGRKLLTGVSSKTIKMNVLDDLFEIVGPKNYHYNQQAGLLQLCGCPWIVMGAKDEGSEKYLRGSTLGYVVGDELSLTPRSFYQMLGTRMSPPGARSYFSTNPDSPVHWLYEHINDKVLKRSGRLYTLHTTLDDNPNLTEEFKETLRLSYKGMFYQRYILGRWVMAEGGIWVDSWSEDLLYGDEDRPKTLFAPGGFVDRWIAVDVGTTHPQVYGDFWDDGNTVWLDRRYWWDSLKEQKQKTNSEYADDLEEFMYGGNSRGQKKFDACQIIVPPEAASFAEELRRRGLWVTDADNDVKEGIEQVAMAFTRKKIRIHKQCKEVIRDCCAYSWDEKAAKRGEEKPLKMKDDGADMVRYGVKTKMPYWRLEA